MIEERELKSTRMWHKSANKTLFSRSSVKLREFALTADCLRYFDTANNNRGKLKGKLELAKVRFVERAMGDESDKRTHGIQIGYSSGSNGSELSVLVILAGTPDEREDWVQLLQFYAREQRAPLQSRYHPGEWMRPGQFSCCGDICRWSIGCEPTTAATSAFVSNVANSNSSLSTSGSMRDCRQGHLDRWVVGLYNYTPQQPGQLSLVQGERYQLLDSSHPDWWYLRIPGGVLVGEGTHRGSTEIMGYVPSSHVRLTTSEEDGRAFRDETDGLGDLWGRDWFYGDISRQQAESELCEEGREGCFLVRCSANNAGDTGLTLSLLTRHHSLNNHSGNNTHINSVRVHHYRIRQCGIGGPYYLSEKHMLPSIPDLIEYHKYNAGGLVVRLRSAPVRNRDCPVGLENAMGLGFGLDEFELDVSDLKLDKNPIGHGQFGVVKKGEFRNMPVAVKQMVEGAMNEDDFIDEARNMRFLNHPNLVRLFGVVLKTRPVMIITEYMKHGSLRDFLRANCSDYWNKTGVLSDVCAQVAKGMAYLEQRNFVHRDLAARNCLVKSVDRRSLQVKVADFGMARFLLDNVYESSAGTKFPVRWAAPEVFQAIYTTRADVWSFATKFHNSTDHIPEYNHISVTNSNKIIFLLTKSRPPSKSEQPEDQLDTSLPIFCDTHKNISYSILNIEANDSTYFFYRLVTSSYNDLTISFSGDRIFLLFVPSVRPLLIQLLLISFCYFFGYFDN